MTVPGSALGDTPAAEPHIGTLNEGSLHAALKQHYAEPGDVFEVPLKGFVIDIVRDGGTAGERLIEIQTGSFGAMGRKLDRLLGEHRMHLVYPIATRTTLDRDGNRRKSPKRGSVYTLFEELVSIPTLLDNPNLTLDVVLVEQTKRQVHDPKARRGRGGWRTADRVLDEIVATHSFDDMIDLVALAPGPLPDRFTTADMADKAGVTRDIAQRMAYCFKAANIIDELDRTKAGKHYRWTM